MIRVNKPKQAPAVLKIRGKAKRRAHVAAYNRGVRSFDFDSGIYGHKTVKDALKHAQHDKCFLCESKITHIAYGDVEHFRPKAAYCQSAQDTLHQPGYYWLAYEWSNLFLACQLCNQKFKKNLFPLANPTARAVSHKAPLKKEQPLFINPSVDEPEEFISFRKEIPYPIDDNPRGRRTIKDLGLDRQKLNDRRLERYEHLEMIYKVAYMTLPTPETQRARDYLARAVLDSAEYASMARAAIAAEFSLIS
jgi:hypothetical protein